MKNNFPPSPVPEYPFESKELKIIGAGIRSKKILFVEVQVYSLGVYVSDEKDNYISSAMNAKDTSTGFSELISSSSNSKGEGATAALVLKFLRSVGTDKVVTAIVEALDVEDITGDSAYKTALQAFKTALTSAMGSKGVVANDEVSFVYFGGEDILILVNGAFGGVIRNSVDLRRRLVDIYTRLEGSVTPAVVQCLKSRYSH